MAAPVAEGMTTPGIGFRVFSFFFELNLNDPKTEEMASKVATAARGKPVSVMSCKICEL